MHTQLNTIQISIKPTSFQVKEEFCSNHTFCVGAEIEEAMVIRQNQSLFS